MTNSDEVEGGLSRRRMLQAVAAVGTAGAVGGVGTAAVLGDSESVFAALTSGRFDLAVTCIDEECSVRGNRVVVDVDDLRPGDSGSTTLQVELDDNPGWLWLGGPCPTDDLGAVLEVDVSLCETEDCTASTPILSGSLNEVLTRLSTGERVGDDCIPGGEPRYLRLDWSFPADVKNPHRFSEETAAFELGLYATQCRHNDGASYPGPRLDCDDPEPTPQYHGISHVVVYVEGEEGCTKLGKHDLQDSHVEPGTCYDFSELYGDFEGGNYQLCIGSTHEKDGGSETVAADLSVTLDGEAGPDLCRVDVKAGPSTVTYDDPAAFDGNATTEPLYAPANGGDN